MVMYTNLKKHETMHVIAGVVVMYKKPKKQNLSCSLHNHLFRAGLQQNVRLFSWDEVANALRFAHKIHLRHT